MTLTWKFVEIVTRELQHQQNEAPTLQGLSLGKKIGQLFASGQTDQCPTNPLTLIYGRELLAYEGVWQTDSYPTSFLTLIYGRELLEHEGARPRCDRSDSSTARAQVMRVVLA